MWKPFLSRATRVALPDPTGVWLGDSAYAVRFPIRNLGLAAGRLVGRIGRAVVDAVEPLPGGRLRLVLDGGTAAVTVAVVPDRNAAVLIGHLEGEPLGVADPGALGRAARVAIAAAGSRAATVRIERGPRGLRAVPVAGDRALDPVPLRGELPVGLSIPASTLRLACWAGLRDGLVTFARASGGQLLVLAVDDAGRRYRIA